MSYGLTSCQSLLSSPDLMSRLMHTDLLQGSFSSGLATPLLLLLHWLLRDLLASSKDCASFFLCAPCKALLAPSLGKCQFQVSL